MTKEREFNMKEKEERESKEESEKYPYKLGLLLTDAEKQIFHFMKNYLDQRNKIEIMPKVRLGDILELDESLSKDKKKYYKIACKHVDYVIVDSKNLDILCVVELDDFTHKRAKRKESDIYVAGALDKVGIKLFRIDTPVKKISKKDFDSLDEYLNTVFAPNCPMCGGKMVPRKCSSGENRGHRFYGCQDLKNCRYTIDIDVKGEKLP